MYSTLPQQYFPTSRFRQDVIVGDAGLVICDLLKAPKSLIFGVPNFPELYHYTRKVVDLIYLNKVEDFEVETERFIDGEETIVVVGTTCGTAMASGTSLNVPLAHICDLAEGRLTRFVDYTDTLAWQQALSA